MRALFRLSRAVVIAAATVFLAAGAHVAGGGILPDPLIVAGILALVALAVMTLTGRKIRPWLMLAVLGTGQFGLHEVFGALSDSASAPSALSPSAEHVHVLAALSAPGIPGHLHGGSNSTSMLVAHAIATVLTALLLARGEAALWALLAWLRPLVRLLVAASPLPRPTAPAFTEEALPRAWRSLRLPARRGPPSAFAVV
ncbi:hypothetical protein [Sinomonas susongensis]|uniref:hypothetical protein n=1 Tax=Sinomonas susongensis TaxID=1324851 RepID=UPI0011081226|nr:hypothetical protein [Sinomonas susongensis]